jgi:predicted short-subunit dehydrogenase-like oxidoreductase (DUF2520 family)
MRGGLSIIGAGRVGQALGTRLHELGWEIDAVVTKNDDVILKVARELARIGDEELRGKVVLHTSGALNSSALQALRECGAITGSMHPLQSFSGVAIPPLEGKLFAIEGDPVAVRLARQIVRALGGLPVQIASDTKVLYHAAAALAAGHVLAIEEAATRILMLTGMKRGEAVRALLQLTRQVLENFERLGPRAAWTGPLARGDYRVVSAHLDAMRQLPQEFAGAYAALNKLASLVLSSDAAEIFAQQHRHSRRRAVRVKAHSAGGKS